jgi:hypothetical protein
MMKQPEHDQDIHVDADVAPGSDAPPPRHRRMSPLRIFGITIIVVCALVGVIALLVWLIYRPSNIQVSVDAATLSRFVANSTASPTALSFNLTAGLIITNPNARVAVYYDLLRAEGIYLGERFDRIALPITFQAAKRADVVRCGPCSRGPRPAATAIRRRRSSTQWICGSTAWYGTGTAG